MKSKIIIYQLLVRLAGNKVSAMTPWGSLEQNGCGKFNDLNQSFLNEVKSLGCTHIWLTGVIEHATSTAYDKEGIPASNPLVVKGRAGSPYAIRDYFDVHPDLAVNVPERMHEFESLIERCQSVRIGTIIDFVPNHLAREYQSDQPKGIENQFGENDRVNIPFDRDNNFYYIPDKELELPAEIFGLPGNASIPAYREFPARATGNDCFSHRPGFNDWYETVKLNYGTDYIGGRQTYFEPIPDTWHKMLQVLMFWADKKIGGFRCDMAEMVPVEFWEWAIDRVRTKYPEIVFIAEIYNASVYKTFRDAGFDYLYDKVGLYDTCREVLAGNQHAGAISEVWQSLDGLDRHMLRFMENHDEQRITSKQFAGRASAGIPSMTVAATMHQGPVMLYFGQELGEAPGGVTGFSGDDGRTSIFDYCHLPLFQQWYNRGTCNVEMLPADSRQLRAFYTRLLNLCHDPVISRGAFYDLMWANKHQTSDRIYAFIRHLGEKAWLITANFSPSDTIRLNLHIPDHYWDSSGQSKDILRGATELLPGREINPGIKFSTQLNGLELILPPHSSGIISMQQS